MRAAQFLVAVLAVFAMNSCAMADFTSKAVLKCEVKGAAAVALCDAVRADLLQRNLAGNDSVQLVLIASAPHSNILRARIDIIQGAQRKMGEQAELSIMDLPIFPTDEIYDLARDLVDRAVKPAYSPRKLE